MEWGNGRDSYTWRLDTPMDLSRLFTRLADDFTAVLEPALAVH